MSTSVPVTKQSIPNEQHEFQFEASGAPERDGLSSWRDQRRRILEEMARANGLPLGHRCHVELRDGTSLDGMLLLANEELFLETERNPRLNLRINRCTFEAVEIASVSRQD